MILDLLIRPYSVPVPVRSGPDDGLPRVSLWFGPPSGRIVGGRAFPDRDYDRIYVSLINWQIHCLLAQFQLPVLQVTKVVQFSKALQLHAVCTLFCNGMSIHQVPEPLLSILTFVARNPRSTSAKCYRLRDTAKNVRLRRSRRNRSQF